MRLTHITVRNYRVHRDLRVDFDAARTLIGGPNESGKSTLVEAAHRALFLRAKTGGETQREMISTTHSGHPEVEVKFESRGKSWHVVKRFSGAGGTVTLTETGGGSSNGDEAETKLAALLGVEAIGGGRGAGERAAQQWAHIWVRQGASGEDPAAHANARRDDLMVHLQSGNGAAAMQSALDGEVAAAVAVDFEAMFTKDGKPRAGSEQFTALKDEEESNRALETARETQVRLEQAVQEFQQAEKTKRDAAAALESLRPQLQATEAKLANAAALRGEEKIRAAAAALAAEKYSTLSKADADISALRADVEKRRQSIAPGEIEVQRHANEERECRQREAAAEQALQQAGALVRAARLHRELAAAHTQRLERAAERDALLQKRTEILKVRAERAVLTEKLTKLPPVTDATLKKLQTLDREYSNLEAALNAMAAGLEIVSADTPVTMNGQPLTAGIAHTLTEDAEITIGATRLRVRPGGGDNLTKARQQVQEASVKRQRVLDELGVTSLNAAAEAAAIRRQVESDLRSIAARLEGMGDSRLDAECSTADQNCAAADAEVERRSASVADFPAPLTLADARALGAEWSQRLAEEENKEALARTTRETAALGTQAAAGFHVRAREKVEEEQRHINTARAQLDYLLQEYSADEIRTLELAARKTAAAEAENTLTDIRRSLTELQPDLLERDQQRLKRAADQHTEAGNEAGHRLVAAQTKLASEGKTDPQADLAIARERARAATAHRETKQRHAKAVQLLHELFLAAKQELADRFTRPLAEKVSGYLECLFGPGARAEVRLENNEFTSLQLIRPARAAGAFDFDSLSGGTKEQLATAFRLAMAEVLAASHDGCLPLVFDDAFVNADPDRAQTVQRMLDLAATRGLQVIVLTCDPSRYAALGATLISLPAAGPLLP